MRPFPFGYKPHLFRSFPIDARELVAGLRWSWRGDHSRGLGGAGLVAQIQDADGRQLELVSAASPRNAGGSVVHTGNGVPGNWDNERVFVFLDALAPEVAQVRFALTAPAGSDIRDVSRSWCHLSDRQSEQLILSRDLARAEGRFRLDVFSLERDPVGWRVVDLLRGTRESLHSPAVDGPTQSGIPDPGARALP